jgi:hypothetical protein
MKTYGHVDIICTQIHRHAADAQTCIATPSTTSHNRERLRRIFLRCTSPTFLTKLQDHPHLRRPRLSAHRKNVHLARSQRLCTATQAVLVSVHARIYLSLFLRSTGKRRVAEAWYFCRRYADRTCSVLITFYLLIITHIHAHPRMHMQAR